MEKKQKNEEEELREEILWAIESPGFKHIIKEEVEDLISQYQQDLENEENSRDKDQFIKGQLFFGKTFISAIERLKKD